MKKLAEILTSTGCSLVVEKDGETTTYGKKGVRNLIWLLDNEPERLQGARVADKVVGKAAAMMLVRGGTLEVYAEIISEPALEVLKAHKVLCLYNELVPHIINRDKTGVCPMEEAVMEVQDITAAYNILIKKTGGAQ